ncbi:1-deoxy-D-xylulose-5-phosphate synthase [Anaerovibrio lipolyticus]|uniref:1-deoxy-D-xylulose-5-phosphate synthase n=1 Tax=Anaerovibrio lipolyticus TaxID=82374 RepID=UPI0026F0FC2D|nr:1-deoxy-D-xylulose-5-phosphate synthase [Anaerovibrio lipolyticus]MBE6106641.1 1-deoxy-D-xylulose-5-phosphate synthase [Anaerovibrio lipolyticus]
MSENILEKINSASDVAKCSLEELKALAGEIRSKIINTCATNGGHLAPSLGTVDLTLAMYSVFNPEKDKIVWDVGHQAYSHKILTGRKERFSTLRTKGGITGFPKRSESKCDAFGVGHASTSISAAVGMAIERDIRKQDYSVIAVIGDGAFTGGEAYEGLNYGGTIGKNMIVVLNDNEMSIDKNVGAMSEYLSHIRIMPQYNKAKKELQEFLKGFPGIGETVWNAAGSVKDGIYALLTPGSVFESLGYTYVGPIDGHNIEKMQEIFQKARGIEGPVLIHVRTTKGKGYSFAENQPHKFHGVGKFNYDTGEMIKKEGAPPSYTDIFSDALIELAGKYDNITAITAAMPSGTGLKKFSGVYPERFFDVGIAEEHAMTMAAGMAAVGGKPFVALYSTFAQRAYDQIIHDVCLQNLPVTLCLDRGGLVGADGPTHHGVFDYSYLRHIPNMVVMAPKDENELRNMLYTAANYNGPISVRYPRGSATGVPVKEGFEQLEIGKGEILSRDSKAIVLLAVGSMVKQAVKAAQFLKEKDIYTTVVNMRFVKPLDTGLIDELVRDARLVVTLEENVLAGGFGSGVLEYLADAGINTAKIMRFGIEDKFIEQGSCPELLELCGLLPEQIADRIAKNYGDL